MVVVVGQMSTVAVSEGDLANRKISNLSGSLDKGWLSGEARGADRRGDLPPPRTPAEASPHTAETGTHTSVHSRGGGLSSFLSNLYHLLPLPLRVLCLPVQGLPPLNSLSQIF